MGKKKNNNKLKKIKWALRNLYWSVYGATVKNPSMPRDPKSLLFVCKGNICRSPFAERLAARMASKNGYGRLTFISAGLETSQPLTPPGNAILSATSFGVHLDDHKSRQITDKMINLADMILVMEPWHLKTLKKSYPHVLNKIFLLSLFEKENTTTNKSYYRYNIPDPYGQHLDQFQICYSRIENCISGLFIRISA